MRNSKPAGGGLGSNRAAGHEAIDFRPAVDLRRAAVAPRVVHAAAITTTHAVRPTSSSSSTNKGVARPLVAHVSQQQQKLTFMSNDTMSQMIAMPREFLLHIDAKLVAEHELRERNKDIAMRRELRSVQKAAEVTSKAEAMQQRVERRTSARVAKMLQREDVALREL